MGYVRTGYDRMPEVVEAMKNVRRIGHVLEPEEIKKRRIKAGITLEQAAAATGTKADDIDRWENDGGVQTREYDDWIRSL